MRDGVPRFSAGPRPAILRLRFALHTDASMQRREFVSTGLALGAASWLLQRAHNRPAVAAEQGAAPVAPASERICLFTDHLDDQGYSYADVAKMFALLKIAGPDLTVRGGGVIFSYDPDEKWLTTSRFLNCDGTTDTKIAKDTKKVTNTGL